MCISPGGERPRALVSSQESPAENDDNAAEKREIFTIEITTSSCACISSAPGLDRCDVCVVTRLLRALSPLVREITSYARLPCPRELPGGSVSLSAYPLRVFSAERASLVIIMLSDSGVVSSPRANVLRARALERESVRIACALARFSIPAGTFSSVADTATVKTVGPRGATTLWR